MSDTIPPRSHIDRNRASEQEDPDLHDFSFNELGFDMFTEPVADHGFDVLMEPEADHGFDVLMEPAADHGFDRCDARNECPESDKGLDDFSRQSP